MASQLLTINVGGKKYTTSRQTLTQHNNGDSNLAKWCLKEAHQQVKDNEGNIFIDRDGDLFKYILRYMQQERLVLPKGYRDTDALAVEASYYGVKKLTEELEKNKKKQTAVLWVKDDSPEVHFVTSGVVMQHKIQLWCSIQTWLNLQFLRADVTNITSCLFYNGGGFNIFEDLKLQSAYQRDKNCTIIVTYNDKIKFLSTLVKEGFENKQPLGAFTMYKHS